MKKQLFNALLFGLLMVPFLGAQAQSTVVEAQTTEGKDFYVTFLQGDADDSGSTDGGAKKRFKLSLSISAREAATITIENTFYGFDTVVQVDANTLKEVDIFNGITTDTRIRSNNTDYSATSKANGTAQYCYTYHPEMVDSSALHVKSDKPISLYASNYKAATFDATNVLPTTALQSEYKIVCYTPSDHGGKSSSQGSHFAVVAVEDNTIVGYCPSVATYSINNAKQKQTNGYTLTEEEVAMANYQFGKDTLYSPVLKKGQVWYVWTGKGETAGFGHEADLSGSIVKAFDANTKNAKKVAVFQGNPHTNIPFYLDLPTPPSKPIGERDHIFSQAMPISTWGNTFVLTTSELRDRDVIRVMSLEDGTEVRLNGNLVHTFDFTSDTQHFWEFEIGVAGVSNGRTAANGNFFEGESFLLQTSCPTAVHEFMVSKKYGKDNTSNGDPAMLWINPIEQRIDQITFATYSSENGTTHHYANVVTTADNASHMVLDGANISDKFKDVNGSNGLYKYAKLDLLTTAGSHTLEGDPTKGFIAHVYGCTGNESYGYNAGGATKPLTQYITINGKVFTPDSENTLCGEDTVKFACHPDYEWEQIVWNFGDGQTQVVTEEKDSVVLHYYENSGVYNAYVLISRESSNLCKGQNAVDSIPIEVTIGRYTFEITDVEIPCEEVGKPWVGKIFYSTGGAKVNLTGDNVTIKFDDAAKEGGFKDDELVVKDGYFQITIHKEKAKSDAVYGIDLKITSDCGGTDTTLNFALNFDNNIIQQRYTYLLGLDTTMQKYLLSDFQWYRVSDSTAIEGQVSSNLNFHDLPASSFSGDSYYVCFTLNKGTADEVRKCACAKPFDVNGESQHFNGPEDLIITATYTISGQSVFVNADWAGKTDIDCFAQWIKVDGTTSPRYDVPDGGCTIPAPSDNGLYLLRVTTDGGSRTFKFMINH